MKKIIVIGCPGSGKTTFSLKLSKYLNLPLYHLDTIWHKPDKTHIPRDEFDERIKDIFATDEWIIDGNYNRTIEMRLEQCDTVFLFDLPTEVCLQGAIDRVGKVHCDLPWIETEPDAEFLESISNFPKEVLPGIYNLLDKYKQGKEIVIFKTRDEADEYIRKAGLPKRKPNRLNGFDYSSYNTYFLTLCTKNKEKLFGDIVGAPIGRPYCKLSDYGKIVDEAINNIEKKYDAVRLDKYAIMPDHVHLLVTILPVKSGRPMGAPTVSNIVNQLKGYVTKRAGFSVWQKLYYDHIIRDEADFNTKWEYIENNPAVWLEKNKSVTSR